MTTVAVTGAAGMLGRHLVRDLVERGYTVRALVRDPGRVPPLPPGVAVAHCDLPDAIDADALAGVDVLIHAAYATKEPDPTRARRVNEEGTARLLAIARAAGTSRRVFVSTIAAHAGAPSYYARSKHVLEGLFDPAVDLVVRPGLILAREGAGLFPQMRDIVRRVRVVPLFGGGRQPLQTVHVDDVCAAVAAGLARDLRGAVNVAEPDPPTMREFFGIVAARLGVRCLYVPLPFGPVLAALRASEALGVRLPLRSESLLGLRGLRRVAVDADLRRLGIRARPAGESLVTCLEPIPGRTPYSV